MKGYDIMKDSRSPIDEATLMNPRDGDVASLEWAGQENFLQQETRDHESMLDSVVGKRDNQENSLCLLSMK